MLLRISVTLTTLLSLAAVVVATPADAGGLYGIEPRAAGRKCGSHLTPEAVSKKETAYTSLLAEIESTNRDATSLGAFTIPVNFHVVYSSKDISGGYVP